MEECRKIEITTIETNVHFYLKKFVIETFEFPKEPYNVKFH